jgi:hypothetical protein
MAEGYDLVLAFPDQSPEFAHGFTCGRIWQKMLEAPARDVQETVLAECRPTIEAMAMAKGMALGAAAPPLPASAARVSADPGG